MVEKTSHQSSDEVIVERSQIGDVRSQTGHDYKLCQDMAGNCPDITASQCFDE